MEFQLAIRNGFVIKIVNTLRLGFRNRQLIEFRLKIDEFRLKHALEFPIVVTIVVDILFFLVFLFQ